MSLTPAQRRTNLLLFAGLVVFAIGFCAAILLWMRHRTIEQGGKVYPAAAHRSRNLSADYADFRRLQRGRGEWNHADSFHLRKSA